MRISAKNNAEIVIQANVNKAGDYDAAMARAERMVADSMGDIQIASNCEHEQWIHLCAVWDNYQAAELKDAYQLAK